VPKGKAKEFVMPIHAKGIEKKNNFKKGVLQRGGFKGSAPCGGDNPFLF